MKNRAKCKLCSSIIESFHQYDFVSCKCGEISIDGGNAHFSASAKDFNNFLRVDDEGNEIIVKVVEKDQIEEPQENKPLSRKELLVELDQMITNITNLPTQAMDKPITHYDFASSLLLLSAIFKAD